MAGQRPGVVAQVAPGLRRVLASNPSPMTLWGTNTWIVGEGDVAVIDPGPADPAHLDAILAALRPGERVARIVVTHAHLDHTPLARPLAGETGAPVLAFGDARAGLDPAMEAFAALGGGEGVDADFFPDEVLPDGGTVAAGGWELQAIHTPGHFGNHICLRWGEALFSGDHVMGWATSLVSPPDGSMTDFMASLRRLQGLGLRRMYPGHGDPVEAPEARLAGLIAHREGREAEILRALDAGPATPARLAAAIYRDTPAALLPAAERNVLAHLIDLVLRGLVTADPAPAPGAMFGRR